MRKEIENCSPNEPLRRNVLQTILMKINGCLLQLSPVPPSLYHDKATCLGKISCVPNFKVFSSILTVVCAFCMLLGWFRNQSNMALSREKAKQFILKINKQKFLLFGMKYLGNKRKGGRSDLMTFYQRWKRSEKLSSWEVCQKVFCRFRSFFVVVCFYLQICQ